MKVPAMLFAALLTTSAVCNADTEVLTLNYRTADDVIQVVQSVLGNQGKVSPYGNQLIINASPDKIDEVRNMLAQIDTQPRRLLISVASSDSSYQSQNGYQANGTISGNGVEAQIGRGEINGRDQVRIINRSTQSRGGGTQQVQATEGYPALIQVGQSVPLTTYGRDQYGNPYNNTQYRDVTQGFYVTATLVGDRVNLAISSNQDRVNSNDRRLIDVQSTSTRLSGRVGEWIQLGGTNQQNMANQQGYAQRYSTQGRDDASLQVKVDVLD
ncbi:Secretin [Pseudomonas marincola]|uniref:Secretin n=2 Tax=Pseudomonas marincola TaxID=437900 RepID=A0A653EAR7_9PSED|nr:Secretin [Pseudomonas marincola]